MFLQFSTRSFFKKAGWTIPVLAAAWAAACWGQATSQKTQADDAYYLRKGDVVLMLGDNITREAYFGPVFYEDLKKHYPELVMKDNKPAKDYEGPGIRFVNAGVQSETAGSALKRIDDLLKQNKPTVAVICLGMNDRLKDRFSYKLNLTALVQKLKQADVAVTILTAPSVCTVGHPEVKKYLDVMGEMAQEAKQVAQSESVGFADCYATTRYYQDQLNKDFTKDGIHPNNAGQRLMCNALEDVWGLGKPLPTEGQPRLRPWPKDTPQSQPTSQASSQPAVRAVTPEMHVGEWVNVTNNVGGEKWGVGGVTLLAAVPGKTEVIAGVSEVGLWYSSDGGANWGRLSRMKERDKWKGKPCQIVFDPQDVKTFWLACGAGWPLYKISDNGKSVDPVGDMEGVSGLFVNFADVERKTILACRQDQSRTLQKTIDGGTTWTNIGASLPDKFNANSNPLMLDDKTYLVNAAGMNLELKNGIFRTEDGGTTWRKVSDYSPAGCPLKASDGSIYWAQMWSQGLIKSSDSGKTWVLLEGSVKKTPIELPGGRLVVPVGQQLCFSIDGGKTWKAVGPKIPIPPSGIVYSDGRNCFYVWLSSGDRKADDAIWRMDLPKDLNTFFEAK